MISDPDPERSVKLTQAILQMKKLDLEKIKPAYGK
jgi:hypothetical protein